MKKLLLIGDSIRMNYDKYVAQALEGQVQVFTPYENCRFAAYTYYAIGDWEHQQRFGEDVEMEKREMRLRQLVICSGSPFIGKTLIESGIRDLYSCMVVGLEEGKESLSPFRPNRRFQEGDIIWVVGEQESLDALLQV